MIKIITDSTAYIDEYYVLKNDIKVIPLYVTVGSEEFIEGYPGTYAPIYEKIDETNLHAKTSQPSSQAFIDVYNKIIKDGNEIIVFTISSTLSGTNSVANLAKTLSLDPDKVTVIDSGTTGQNIWGLIMETIEMIKAQKTRIEIEQEIEKLKKTSGICFVPESLDYLKRGGRIGTIKAAISTLLNIKPILSFRNGKLECKKKVIGIQKSISEIISFIPKNAKRIFVIKISNSVYFQQLKEIIYNLFPNVEKHVGDIGPVVGAHVGPAIGVSWISPAY